VRIPGLERLLSLREPTFRLRQFSLPDQRASQDRIGDRDTPLPAPAVPPRQLGRLKTALRRQRGRPEARDHCPLRQSVDLQERPPDPARQSDTLLKVRFGFVDSQQPELGDAKADRRERTHSLAEPGLRHVRGDGRLQLLYLLGDSRRSPR
jgi:hypothetical protein